MAGKVSALLDYVQPLISRLMQDLDRPLIFDAASNCVPAGEFLEVFRRCQTAISGHSPAALPRVATLLPNDWQTGALVLGLAAKTSVLPLNPGLKPSALSAMLADSHVDAVIGLTGDPRLLEFEGPVISRSDLLTPGFTLPDLPLRQVIARPELVLTTSGSTGAPKRVALPPSALLDRAQVIAETLQLGAEDRALHALPMFHIGAFVDLLLAPLLAGGSVALSSGQGAQALWQGLADVRPTWIQLVPTMLQDMLRQRPASLDLSQLRFIRSVSSGLTAELQAEAEDVFGCPVIQMYGMTETAGQICSNPLPEAPRKPLSVGQATRITIEIRDPDAEVLQSGEVGEILVKGPSVIAKYDSSDGLGTAWLSTGDLGWLDAEGYLFLTGRVKEQINRGGEKISPLVIEQAARSVPGVDQAVAYPVPHPSLGESVGLAVVTDGSVTEPDILAQIANQLAQFEMPRTVQIVDQMPRLPGGKLDRRALSSAHHESVEQGESGAPEALSPNDQRIAELWAEVLQSALPRLGTDFFEAGGDSLAATTFVVRLEEMLGRPVSPNILFDHPTLGGLLEALVAPTEAAEETRAVHYASVLSAGWDAPLARPGGLIRVLRPQDAHAPFVWCCQGFDEAEHTAAWMRTGGFLVLPTLFLMKGRTEKDREDLVAALAAELQTVYPKGPFVLGGFCEGARMMERVAARLVQQGRTVRAFLCVDHKFEAASEFPVLHVTSRNLLGYPEAVISFPDLHPLGFEAHAVDVHHDDIMRNLHQMQDRVLPFLTGQRALPLPTPRAPHLDDRPQLYAAQIKASPPWRWRSGVPATLPVELTNKSDHVWQASAESGLTLMAMEADLLGRIENRFLGHAGWDRPIQPGETRRVELPIALSGRSRPMLLRLQLVDQGVTDLPYRSGGVAVYPRLALISAP